MSLRSKILIIMLVVVALYSAVYYSIQHFVIMPSFDTLEREQVKRDIRQCVDAVNREIRQLDIICAEWARSDALFNKQISDFEETGLGVEAAKKGMLDLVCVLDLDGKLLWSRNLYRKGRHSNEMSPFKSGEEDQRKFLLNCRNADKYVFGLVMSDDIPMLVSCRPITGSDKQSSPSGILVMGRLLTKGLVDALGTQAKVAFDLWPADTSNLPADCLKALEKINSGEEYVISVRDNDEVMSAYAVMTDVRGYPAILLRARLPRFIGLTGMATVRSAQFAVVTSALLLLVVMILSLQELVISPVEKLTGHVVKFADEQKPTEHPKRGKNEIKTLMQEFDLMVEQIRKHEEQMIQAHKMIALGTLVSGVAHEISNPNGVITINAAMIRKISARMFEVLDQLAKEKGEFEIGGKSYREARAELESLTGDVAKSAERIKTIVSDLTNFVRQDTTDLSEVVDINQVVKDTLGLVSSTIVEITENLSVSYGANVPVIKGNSNRLQQVFINLISNACHALKGSGRSGIRIKTFFSEDKKEVCVVFEDDGEGISKEDLPRIKDPFYTTRRDEGGTGLGLAICDGIVAAHGGTMSFESEKGKGTKVTVHFPVDRVNVEGNNKIK